MLRYPAKRYIYYLLSRRSLKADEVIARLDDLLFPLPQDRKDLDRLIKSILEEQRRMQFPVGYDPSNQPFNAVTAKFLSRWEITDMWSNDEYVRSATDIVHEPQIRRTLEAFLIGPLNPQAIARRLQQRFSLPEAVMNPRVVRLYAHYYWDYSAMNNAEWKDVFTKWMAGYTTDDYQTSLMAPRSAAGAALSLAVVDRSTDSLSPVIHYATARDMAFRMFLEAVILQRPGLGRAQSALNAFQIMRGADEELAKHRGSSAELLEELRRIEVSYDSEKVLSVHDIPGLKAVDIKALPSVVETEGETVEEPNDEHKPG